MIAFLEIDRWGERDFTLRGGGGGHDGEWMRFCNHARDKIIVNWEASDHTVLFFDLEEDVYIDDLIKGFEEFYKDHRSS